jgi:hypothetical protein
VRDLGPAWRRAPIVRFWFLRRGSGQPRRAGRPDRPGGHRPWRLSRAARGPIGCGCSAVLPVAAAGAGHPARRHRPPVPALPAIRPAQRPPRRRPRPGPGRRRRLPAARSRQPVAGNGPAGCRTCSPGCVPPADPDLHAQCPGPRRKPSRIVVTAGLAAFTCWVRPRWCRLLGGAGCWRDRPALARRRRTGWIPRRPDSWHQPPRGSA